MIEIDVDGIDSEERRLRKLAAGLADLRPFWPKVNSLFIEWMGLQFSTQGAFGGAPWAPLSPNYYAWKSVVYPGKGILYATGTMRQAASRPSRDASADSLTLTIEDEKVGYHQTGTDRMPARPLIFRSLPAVAMAQIDRAAQDYVDDLVSRIF